MKPTIQVHFLNACLWTRAVFSLLIFTLFMSVSAGFTLYNDFTSKLDLNECYLHMYPLLWTNFWLLPPFYFMIFFFFQPCWRLNFLLLFTYTLYLTELGDFNISNFTYLNTSLVSYNVLLTNYLNKYHPFIFFTSTWFSFKFLFNSTGYYFSSYKYKSLVILKEQKRLNLRLLVLVLLALSLGGVWAFQEASWGGFWNWDSSETFGLLFYITALYFVHIRFKLTTLVQFITSSYFVICVLMLVYCFLQLNFDLLSHNFGIKFLHLFSNSFFYKEGVVLFTSLVVYLNFYYRYDRYHILTLYTYWGSYKVQPIFKCFIFWWQVLVICILVVLLYSLLPLVNYSFFSLVSINWFNLSFSIPPIIILCYIQLLYWFTLINQPHRAVPLIITTVVINIIYSFGVFNLLTFKFYQIIHSCLLTLTSINILTYKTNFILWSLVSNNISYVLNTGVSFISCCWVCDSVFIDSGVFYNTTRNVINAWTLFFDSNAPNVNQLTLVLSNLGANTLYQTTWRLPLFYTLIIVPYVQLLILGTVAVLGFTVLYFWRNSYRL